MTSAPSRRRAAIINVTFQYAGIVLTVIQGVLLVPLYVRWIPAELYGSWLATGGVLAWVDLVDAGVGIVLQQRVAFTYGMTATKELPRVVGTGLLMGFTLALLPLAGWPAARFVETIVNYSGSGGHELRLAFRLALVSLSMGIAADGLTAVNTGLQRSAASGIIFIGSSLAGLAVTVVLLARGMGLIALPLGLFARNVLLVAGHTVTLAAWWRSQRIGLPMFCREEFRSIAAASAFSFTTRLGYSVCSRLDALIAARLLSPVAAVVLTLTGRIFDVARMLGDRFAAAMVPSVSHLSGEGIDKRLSAIVRLVLRSAVQITALGAAVGIAINGIFMPLWVGPAFYGGLMLSLLLGIASCVSVMSTAGAQSLFALGKVRDTSAGFLIEAALRIPLQCAAVVMMGLVGMPLGGIIAGLAGSNWYFHKRLRHMLWNSTRQSVFLRLCGSVGIAVTGGFLISFTVTLWHPAPLYWVAVITIAVTTAVAVAVALLLADNQRSEIVGLLRASRIAAVGEA